MEGGSVDILQLADFSVSKFDCVCVCVHYGLGEGEREGGTGRGRGEEGRGSSVLQSSAFVDTPSAHSILVSCEICSFSIKKPYLL